MELKLLSLKQMAMQAIVSHCFTMPEHCCKIWNKSEDEPTNEIWWNQNKLKLPNLPRQLIEDLKKAGPSITCRIREFENTAMAKTTTILYPISDWSDYKYFPKVYEDFDDDISDRTHSPPEFDEEFLPTLRDIIGHTKAYGRHLVWNGFGGLNEHLSVQKLLKHKELKDWKRYVLATEFGVFDPDVACSNGQYLDILEKRIQWPVAGNMGMPIKSIAILTNPLQPKPHVPNIDSLEQAIGCGTIEDVLRFYTDENIRPQGGLLNILSNVFSSDSEDETNTLANVKEIPKFYFLLSPLSAADQDSFLSFYFENCKRAANFTQLFVWPHLDAFVKLLSRLESLGNNEILQTINFALFAAVIGGNNVLFPILQNFWRRRSALFQMSYFSSEDRAIVFTDCCHSFGDINNLNLVVQCLKLFQPHLQYIADTHFLRLTLLLVLKSNVQEGIRALENYLAWFVARADEIAQIKYKLSRDKEIRSEIRVLSKKDKTKYGLRENGPDFRSYGMFVYTNHV